MVVIVVIIVDAYSSLVSSQLPSVSNASCQLKIWFLDIHPSIEHEVFRPSNHQSEAGTGLLDLLSNVLYCGEARFYSTLRFLVL
jgi:hypothetical protein